ncbi:ceramide glucosyltransferase [Cupriavidus gilardii J11]|uniref:Ceramide glucosyltransferase n=1 Tax=Cupriavidus gilardii J11 TaxID=936133 RepID=A0A562B942_9BURK|nr:ceramide glucosyltransferase [Cupriavidus gilardii J11]
MDRLADDYWLGALTRAQGLRSVLSDVVVTTDVVDEGLRSLWEHELRWMRTIRSLDPRGFALAFITFVWPMLALGVMLDPVAPVAVAAVIGAVARTLLCANIGSALVAPLRDVLLLAEWAVALAGRRVRWRRVEMVVDGLAASGGMGAAGKRSGSGLCSPSGVSAASVLPSPPAPLPQAGEGRKTGSTSHVQRTP